MKTLNEQGLELANDMHEFSELLNKLAKKLGAENDSTPKYTK